MQNKNAGPLVSKLLRILRCQQQTIQSNVGSCATKQVVLPWRQPWLRKWSLCWDGEMVPAEETLWTEFWIKRKVAYSDLDQCSGGGRSEKTYFQLGVDPVGRAWQSGLKEPKMPEMTSRFLALNHCIKPCEIANTLTFMICRNSNFIWCSPIDVWLVGYLLRQGLLRGPGGFWFVFALVVVRCKGRLQNGFWYVDFEVPLKCLSEDEEGEVVRVGLELRGVAWAEIQCC